MTASRSIGMGLLQLGMVLMAGAMAPLAWFLWSSPLDATAVPAASPTVVATPTATAARTEPAPIPAIAQLSETVARPLFSQTRRPAGSAAATTAKPAATSTLGELELLGTMVTKTTSTALLHIKEPPSNVWAAVGTVTAGWKIVSIDQDGVVLEADGQRKELEFFPNRTPAAH